MLKAVFVASLLIGCSSTRVTLGGATFPLERGRENVDALAVNAATAAHGKTTAQNDTQLSMLNVSKRAPQSLRQLMIELNGPLPLSTMKELVEKLLQALSQEQLEISDRGRNAILHESTRYSDWPNFINPDTVMVTRSGKWVDSVSVQQQQTGSSTPVPQFNSVSTGATQDHSTTTSDCWALGMTIWYMIVGQDLLPSETSRKGLQDEFDRIDDDAHDSIHIHPGPQKLVYAMLHYPDTHEVPEENMKTYQGMIEWVNEHFLPRQRSREKKKGQRKK
mmetsp:Transcript_137821/g.250629  ORF Transcript_137821/g.250629 Transcript_137821/m.250629 type:complete len:277 (-) Transcript_137821:77-907(-)